MEQNQLKRRYIVHTRKASFRLWAIVIALIAVGTSVALASADDGEEESLEEVRNRARYTPEYCLFPTLLETHVARYPDTRDKARILALRCRDARLWFTRCINEDNGGVTLLIYDLCWRENRRWQAFEIAHHLIWLDCRVIEWPSDGYLSIVGIQLPDGLESEIFVPGLGVCPHHWHYTGVERLNPRTGATEYEQKTYYNKGEIDTRWIDHYSG